MSDLTSQLADIVCASSLAMINTHLDGRIQIWNSGAEALSGFSAAEMHGNDLLRLVPSERTEEALALTKCVKRAAAGEALSIETLWHHKSGDTIGVHLWLAPVRDSIGSIVGLCGVGHGTQNPSAVAPAQIAAPVEDARATPADEREFLQRAFLESAERESRRIGQELHDDLCQHLLGIAFSAEALATGFPTGSTEAEEAGSLAELINSAVRQARDIARGLNPVELDSSGLMAAIASLVRRTATRVQCRLECELPVLLPDATAALHAYRIAEEAIANAVKHSGSAHIVVRLREDDDHIHLEIEDDGSGFQRELSFRQGLGLESMKYRAQRAGGRLDIHTRMGGGTRVTCVLPR